MENLAFSLWLGSGIFLMAIEFLVPGLVMVFVGLGSLTVVFGMHFGYIDGILQQFTTFFISSIIYLLTLRFLVLRFVPSVTRKANIDEDEEGYDKGGYLSGASGYINQAIDCIEVFVIPRVEQEEADALLKLVDMAKDDIENGRVKPASSVIKELRDKYK